VYENSFLGHKAGTRAEVLNFKKPPWTKVIRTVRVKTGSL